LIGHELGHIKQHYAKINIPISIIAQVFPFVSAAGSWYLLKNHHVAIKIIASLSTFTTIGLLCNIVKAYLTRYYEYDADRKSALLLKSSQDGISYINHINNLINESALDQVNPDTLSWIKQLLITHPTNENRITQLETLLF
jgi:Zn-dependent protease with chaperone function